MKLKTGRLLYPRHGKSSQITTKHLNNKYGHSNLSDKERAKVQDINILGARVNNVFRK
jgi:hypothetical protein